MISKHSRSTLCATLGLGLVLVAACTSAPQGPVNRYSGGEGMRDSHKVEGNRLLAANLETKNVITTRRNELLVVQFDLVNRNSSQLGFQWAVDWYDRQGIQVPNAARHWEPMRLAGNASQTVTIVAPHADASQWQLQVGSRDEVQ